jgi:hypothetical protein
MHGGKSTGRPPTHGQRTLKAKLRRNQVDIVMDQIFNLIQQSSMIIGHKA